MFRRRPRAPGALDRAALEANCLAVIRELAEDFDWRLADPRNLAARVAARAAEPLLADLAAAADLALVRRTIEREACAEYFADLYDDLGRDEPARSAAAAALLRAEEQVDADGPRLVYRGYLYRAAVFYLLRWTGRKGWAPPQDLVDDLARTAAEDALLGVLRAGRAKGGARSGPTSVAPSSDGRSTSCAASRAGSASPRSKRSRSGRGASRRASPCRRRTIRWTRSRSPATWSG
jgi:hypothetical protein